MAQFATSTPQLERGKACLRCRRRKMRCDGQRPTCNQCTRSSILDCEYTDEGPTASQILEQNISYLEARIRELEGDTGSITLHDPHARRNSVSLITRGISPEQSAAAAVQRNQRIMQAFVTYAPDFGFFLHIPRFLDKLKASIPHTPQSPLPAALVHAVHLVGVLFAMTTAAGNNSSDEDLKREAPQILERAQQALSVQLDPVTTLYMLQAEVLIAMYLYHTNRRMAGNYHAVAAMSIAVGCKLHKLRSTEWMSSRRANSLLDAQSTAIPDVQLFPPMDDTEEGERIRAFWTVFTLDRCLVVVSRAPSLLAQQGSAATRVDTPWPLEMSDYEQHLLMPQGNTSARTVEYFLDGLTTELPNQSLLALHAKAAILFERSAHLAEKWSPNIPAFQVQFITLDARIEQLKAVLPPFESPSTGSTNPRQVRQLLAIYTLCHAATLQLHARFEPTWDVDRSKALNAAVSAAGLLQVANVGHLVFVDPMMGTLWGLVGQTLANALVNLKQNVTFTMSPSVAVSPQEIMVTASLNSVLDAMDALRDTCPLIAEEAAKLQSYTAKTSASGEGSSSGLT